MDYWCTHMPKKGEKHITAGSRLIDGGFVTPSIDWQVEILNMLTDAGVNGIAQSALTNRFYKLGVSAKDIRDYLETFRLQHGVQRFSIKNATIWRATTKLRSLV